MVPWGLEGRKRHSLEWRLQPSNHRGTITKVQRIEYEMVHITATILIFSLSFGLTTSRTYLLRGFCHPCHPRHPPDFLSNVSS